MTIELIPMQPQHLDVLLNLWQYYQLESSVRDELDVDSTGRFETPTDLFAKTLRAELTSKAFLVNCDGAVAGFLLTDPVEVEGQAMTEFADLFILPRYRGRGVATSVIEQVILASDRPWLIAVFRHDPDALAFWHRALARLPFASVREIDPPETPAFHEFVVQEGFTQR